MVEFSSSLVKIIFSCLTWNLSNLSRALVNVQNIWSFAEAWELSLKFWAGCCLPSSCEPATGLQPYSTEPPSSSNWAGFYRSGLAPWCYFTTDSCLAQADCAHRMFWLQKILKAIHIIIWMYERMLSCSWIKRKKPTQFYSMS